MFKYEFPEYTLLKETIVYNFEVPVVPELGISIPGAILISAKAKFAVSLKLEKAIKIGYFYSKHVKFTLPIGWYKDKLNNPNPSSLVKIYGNSGFKNDFSQFKQIPYVESLLTVTPVLSVKWPYFGKLVKMHKATPVWIHRHSIQKRDLTDSINKFFQLTLYSQLPLLVTGTLKLCTDKCQAKTPLQAQLQVGLGNLKIGFKGLSLDEYFTIPIKLSSPPFGICLPFFDICPGKSI